MIWTTLLLLFGMKAFAVDLQTVRDLLPPELKSLTIGQSTTQDVLKKIGRANYREGKKLYWIKNGLKYAIHMEFNEKNKLITMSYVFTENPPPLSALGVFDQKKLALNERFLDLKEQKFDLQLDPTTQTISRIKLK